MGTYNGITILDILFRDIENMNEGDHEFICGDEVYQIEVLVYKGDQDWIESINLGNNIPDERMLICIIKGNLMIRSGVKITSTTRKRGFLLFCTETITNFGEISMTARGCIHPGQNVYLWHEKDFFDFIPSNSITARAPGRTGNESNYKGTAGGAGTNRLPGNGGSGSKSTTHARGSGAGGLATSYSGGSGGGGGNTTVNGGNAPDNGGAGGSGEQGAGNPGAGTGGLLIIFGKIINLMSSGVISARGGSVSNKGGGSGGGSINIYYKEEYATGGSITVAGGTSSSNGGAGGAGSVSIRQITPHSIADWRLPHYFFTGSSLFDSIINGITTSRTGPGYITTRELTEVDDKLIETNLIIWPFDIVVFQGNQVWTESKDLGVLTNNQDQRGLLVVVKGNLTIEEEVVIKSTSERRAFLFMVFGHLIINGVLNITAQQQLKAGTIPIFTNNSGNIVKVPSSQQNNGLAVLYASRITNNGELIMGGNYREIYYQGLFKEGKCISITSTGTPDALKINKIVTGLELETKHIVGELI